MLRRVRRHDGAKLRFEALEGRMMLSVNVAMIDHGKTMSITGGASGENTILITETSNVITVTGETNTDTTSTVLNGAALGNFTGTVTKDLKIKFGNGDDFVSINSLSETTLPKVIIPNDLSVQMGNGNDELDAENAFVGHDTTISMHSQSSTVDGVFISDSSTGKNFSLTTGAGDDQVQLTNDIVDKNATVNTGAGDDTVSLSGDTVVHNVKVNLGSGNDSLTTDATSEGGHKTTLNGGSGTDTLSTSRAITANGKIGTVKVKHFEIFT